MAGAERPGSCRTLLPTQNQRRSMRRGYIAMSDGLLVVENGDAEWSASEQLESHRLECAVSDPTESGRAFVGTFDAGLLRTTDGGQSFHRVGEDTIESETVTALTVRPGTERELWVGTEPSCLYRAAGGSGAFERIGGLQALPSEPEWSFPPRPDTHHVRWIAFAPTDPERVYVAIEAGAFVLSTDGGETWRERPSGSRRDNHTIATHPARPDRVYVAAGDGYAESHDAGESWQHPDTGLEHRYVWGVAVDPGDPETVLVSAASGAMTAHRRPGEAYLYRKRGDTWERLGGDEFPTGEGALRAVLTSGSTAGEMWAATNHGLFHTTDAGDSWDEIPIEWPTRFRTSTCRGLALESTSPE